MDSQLPSNTKCFYCWSNDFLQPIFDKRFSSVHQIKPFTLTRQQKLIYNLFDILRYLILSPSLLSKSRFCSKSSLFRIKNIKLLLCRQIWHEIFIPLQSLEEECHYALIFYTKVQYFIATKVTEPIYYLASHVQEKSGSIH